MRGQHILLLILLLLSFLPIWRCGLRDKLTFWDFVREHTIYGSPVEYIPEEDYESVLQ